MVASGAVCGDAFPGNGLPVRGLWSLIPVLVAFPLILCQQPPVTDRLPRHSIRIHICQRRMKSGSSATWVEENG